MARNPRLEPFEMLAIFAFILDNKPFEKLANQHSNMEIAAIKKLGPKALIESLRKT